MHKQTPLDASWSFEDIYRLLMLDIEPELLPERSEQIAEKCKNMNEEERKKLFHHYIECVKEFAQRLNKLTDALGKSAADIQSELHAYSQKRSTSEEQEILGNLEEFFDENNAA